MRDASARDAVGTVICAYKVRARIGSPERVDVQFASNTVMWGVAANEFEPIEDSSQVA